MTRSMAQRNAARKRTLAAIADRNTVLENTLRDVWVWLATDSLNTDRLRTILLTADRDAQVHAALNRLLESSNHAHQ